MVLFADLSSVQNNTRNVDKTGNNKCSHLLAHKINTQTPKWQLVSQQQFVMLQTHGQATCTSHFGARFVELRDS